MLHLPIRDPDLPVPDAEHPNAGVRVRRRRRLQRVAAAQSGLFTRQQAAEAGLDRRARHHHLSYGNWRRTEAPTVFRLVGWPEDDDERFRAWSLWAGPGAAVTSWAALELHGVRALEGIRDLDGTGNPHRWTRRVDLFVPRPRTRTEQRHRLVPAPADPQGEPAVRRIWTAWNPTSDVVVRGIRTRPIDEAICAAAMLTDEPLVALALLDRLIGTGQLDRNEVMLAASRISAGRVSSHLFRRRASRPS